MSWTTAVIGVFVFVAQLCIQKWLDVAIWPKLSDWWAARTIRTLKARIAELEESLGFQPITALDISIYSWRLMFKIVVLSVIASIPLIFGVWRQDLLYAYYCYFRLPGAAQYLSKDLNQLGFLLRMGGWFLLLSIISTLAWSGYLLLGELQTPAGRERYKNNIDSRIVKLRIKLALKESLIKESVVQ